MTDKHAKRKRPMGIKIYLVMQTDNIIGGELVRAAKLTRRAAQRIVNSRPGCRIQKVLADKD